MEFDQLAAMAVCPCCGRETGDSTCPGCGYPDLYTPDTGERYALVAYREVKGGVKKEEAVQTARYLSRRCCLGEDVVARVMDTVYYTSSRYQWAETPGEKKERLPLSFWEVAGAVALGNLIVLPVWLFLLALFF